MPDPSVGLHIWLKSVWATVTGYTVPITNKIKFDTKFGSGKGFFNFILVEEMPKNITPQTLGSGRYNNIEIKRIQILCIGTDAKTTKFNMEKHIESLINGNPTAMQATYGIDTIHVESFTEIPTSETDNTITELMPTTGFQKARSVSQVSMKYEQEFTTA